MRRVNVSLDTRDPDRFRYITRHGDVHQVLGGIRAAQAAGLRVKINAVALKGLNDAELPDLLQWCVDEQLDLSLIETMPLGAIDEDRVDRFLPLTVAMEGLQRRFPWCAMRIAPAARPATGGRGHGHATGPDLATHRQFLRWLQPRAPDHRGQAISVPGP